MTTFDKRKEGFEQQFAHDEELKFKANARRNKLVGLWAAQKLGLAGPDAEVYAKDVVLAEIEGTGVVAKLRKDFDAAIKNTFQVLKTRIDQFGVASPNVSLQENTGRIILELPGVEDPGSGC